MPCVTGTKPVKGVVQRQCGYDRRQLRQHGIPRRKGTLKEIAETLGKETIDTYNTGESRGREVSHSLNYQKLGKELMSIDELAVMDGSKCILQLRGVRPFCSSKYDITKHPQYRNLSDENPKNAYDIEQALLPRLALKSDEVYESYEVMGEEGDSPRKSTSAHAPAD